jgi:multiple sugar transport system substrate-binding protein
MDVIWTSEFAEAHWIKPFPADIRAEVSKDTLKGSLGTATYKGQLYGAPANSNTQLLWYRKDKVKNPPKTWAQLIETAKSLHTKIEVQVADPSIDNSKEDSGRLAFEKGVADFQINYPFIYPSAAAIKGFQDKIGWAPYPQIDANTPAKAPIGGFNFGVGNYTKHPKQAFDAVACLRDEHNQRIAAVKGGLPPTLSSLYDNPDFQKDYPFAQLIRKSIENGAVRPRTPLYADLSLALFTALSPPSSFDVKAQADGDLKQTAQDALDGKGLN